MKLRMKKGFTLIELIIVIVIIGILALIALPRYFSNLENARRAEAQSTLRSLREAELANFSKNGTYSALNANQGLNVNLTGVAQDDIQVMPNVSNFSYAFVAASNALTATHNVANNPTGSDYYMCVESGKFNTGGAPVCP